MLRRRVEARIARILYFIGNGILVILQKIFWPWKRPHEARNVCVYRIGNIGDVVCAIPAMYSIRHAYPEARITLLSSPGKKGMSGSDDLLNGVDWLDEIIMYYPEDIDTFIKQIRFIWNLRPRKFDVWVELPNDLATMRVLLRNILVAKISGADWAAGWRLNTIRLWGQAQSEYLVFDNEVTRLLKIVTDYGMDGKPLYPSFLKGSHAATVDELLRGAGYSSKQIIAIAPGAKRSINRWAADRFVKIGMYLVERGYATLVVGGASDKEICLWIANAVGAESKSVAGRLSLLEISELLRRCCLLISNDSGPQHLAAAVGTPCISLFSSRDIKGKWYPSGSDNVVIQKPVSCHTCFLEECPYDNMCIKLIHVQDVIEVIDRKLRPLPISTAPRFAS